MKHLSELSLAACCGGGRPSPGDAAHLRACPACREELEALRALARDLAAAPKPPRSLRRATLGRLGLAAPRRHLWAAPAPRWAAFLAGVLVLAWVLPLPRVQGPGVPVLPGKNPTPPARPAPILALAPGRHEALRPARTRARRRAEETEVAKAVSLPAPPAAWTLARSSKDLTQRAEAVGNAEASETSTTSTKVEAPSTPQPPALSLDSIRGNLIRPGQGPGLSFTLTLGENGPLRVVVVDSQGHAVATLFDGDAGPGSLDLSWNGGSAPSGAYTILIQAGGTAKAFSALVVR